MKKSGLRLAGITTAAILLGFFLIVACGKKAPPLPPLVIVPQSPGGPNVRQWGDAMVFSFSVPTMSTDYKTPVDISKVEIYRLKDLRVAVAQTQTAPQTQTQTRPQTQSQPQSQTQTSPQSQPQSAPAQEEQPRTLTPEEFDSRAEKLLEIPAEQVDDYIREGTFFYIDKFNAASGSTDYQNWFYYAVKIYGAKKKTGGYSELVAEYPVDVPKAPTNFTATYDQSGVHLTWTPPTADIFGKPLAADTLRYSIFRGKNADFNPGRPINAEELNATTYTDGTVEYGQAYYYFVRAAINGHRKGQASANSNVILMFPQDTFPPQPPEELNAVAAKEGMVLIWSPNSEGDIAGYNVYRSLTPGGPYEKVNQDLIRETTFTDTGIQPKQKYYYVVTAVDAAPVPNESKYSNEVAEVQRH